MSASRSLQTDSDSGDEATDNDVELLVPEDDVGEPELSIVIPALTWCLPAVPPSMLLR